MKVSPYLSKSPINIWFKLTCIGIYKIKKDADQYVMSNEAMDEN